MTVKLGDYTDLIKAINMTVDCIFADPPDNIGLNYAGYSDKKTDSEYYLWLSELVHTCYKIADTTWISYNVKHMPTVVDWCQRLNNKYRAEVRHMVQRFTFGQHRTTDFGNNFRPLVRLTKPHSQFYPNHIRVESERQRLGDKRANPDGRVPGDVFDFPRVVGNSRQRRKWHPTQLNEGLVERCLASCCKAGDTVFDPFMGTGTTLRVCKQLGLQCLTCDIDKFYCERIAAEHVLKQVSWDTWIDA